MLFLKKNSNHDLQRAFIMKRSNCSHTAEEVLVDLLAVGLGNKPRDMSVSVAWGNCQKNSNIGVHCREFLALFGESL